MKLKFIQFLIILLPLISFGQTNLVPDPSFEDTIRCPSDSTITKARIWYNPTICGSPDYFYPTIQGNPVCLDQYPAHWGGGAYVNTWGHQLPRTGLAYGGMAVAQGSEFMATQLSDSLIAGKHYAISFYTSLGDAYFSQGAEGLDLISVCFKHDSLTDYNINTCWSYLGTLTADAGNQSGNFLSDTTNWMLVRDTFLAIGGERYMILGNIDTANTQYYNSLSPTFCYYYFDDFDVHCIDCITDTSNPSPYSEITLYPNISDGNFLLKGNFSEGTIVEIFDALGQLVYKKVLGAGNVSEQLNLTMSQGIYLWRVRNGDEVLKTGKLSIVN